MAEKTLVITTGGTIDAMYSPEKGIPYYVPVPKSELETCVPAALDKLGLRGQCDFWMMSMKDSKDITPHDRELMVHNIIKGGYKQVVITHGTDTMPETGRYLKSRLTEKGMEGTKIILTGAMYPLRDGDKKWRGLDMHDKPILDAPLCDGWKNLGLALSHVKDMNPGVYIEMGQGPWDPNRIKKRVDREMGKDGKEMVQDSAFEPDGSAEHAQAIKDSKTKPQLFVLLASKDCDDTKKFLPTLKKIEAAFGEKLNVVRQEGSNKDRDSNPEGMKKDLTYFAYDKEPKDNSENQRGHFPSGCVYKDGKEVYRLPSDTRLTTMKPLDLARSITKATGVAYRARELSNSSHDRTNS